ncbi:hypothetical protein [Clostridium thailandense]|uniref:hypothetical protein n=1 Tax=Clostridium thailandense TaxID=2794346 RepID=UPI0039898E4A
MKNSYRIISVLFFYFSVLIIVLMVAHSIIDYHNYLKHPEYSAPFYVNLIFISVAYSIPIIMGFLLSAILKKKLTK